MGGQQLLGLPQDILGRREKGKAGRKGRGERTWGEEGKGDVVGRTVKTILSSRRGSPKNEDFGSFRKRWNVLF
jgi:hypothetical protein